MRATTHMGFYERALEERGMPTHVVGGRGYWSQQQVADLRNWLAALANPLDELALYSVLASPLVGVSLDTVALLGLHARGRGRDAWWTLREPDGLMDLLAEADRRRIETFVRRFESERAAAARVSLETLIDRAVTATGYDTHVLSLPAGDRRMANVRKLMRLAREYERDEGRDLRGFIDFVAERDLIQDREGEAPLEAEELDAVRLMTVHRAKGLEFPVVCMADLGKGGREDTGSLRISGDGEIGLRLASMGGGRVDTAELERIREQQKLAGEEEERRIFYVAATRAQEHLILSGATDLERRPEPQPLEEPMRWVWRGLCPDLPAEGAAGLASGSYEGREVKVRWQRCAPDTLDELLPAADRAPARPAPAASNGHEQAPLELGAVPAPRALPVSRLSYSAIAGYERCSYRFYLERALRLPGGSGLEPGRGRRSAAERGVEAALELEQPEGPGPADEPRAADELSALVRGSLVHELLEGLDFRRPRAPSPEEVSALIERSGVQVRAEDVADLIDMVERFARSELRERIARARNVRAELPFSFTVTPPEARGRSILVNGVVDVHAAEEDRTLIVDYKSDPLEGRAAGGAGGRGLRGAAARVRAGRAALGRRARRGGLRAARAPGRAGPGGVRGSGCRAPGARAADPCARGGGRALRTDAVAARGAVRELPRPARFVQLAARAHPGAGSLDGSDPVELAPDAGAVALLDPPAVAELLDHAKAPAARTGLRVDLDLAGLEARPLIGDLDAEHVRAQLDAQPDRLRRRQPGVLDAVRDDLGDHEEAALE